MHLPPTRRRSGRDRCANRAARRLVIALAALSALAGRASAQRTTAGWTCVLPTPAHDSVHVVVTAIAKVDSSNQDDPRTLPENFLPYIVEAVRVHFTPPARLDLPSISGGVPTRRLHWPRTITKPPGSETMTRSAPMLEVDAYFTLDTGRAPRDVALGRSSMNDALRERIAAAIAAISPDDYGLIPPHANGVRIHLHVGAQPFDSATVQPFFATWLPVYRVDSLARPLHEEHPHYPFTAQNTLVGDSVLTAFAIDQNGRAIPGTIDILAAHYRDFIQAITPVILKSTFRPLVAEGCRVTSTVVQAFVFRVMH